MDTYECREHTYCNLCFKIFVINNVQLLRGLRNVREQRGVGVVLQNMLFSGRSSFTKCNNLCRISGKKIFLTISSKSYSWAIEFEDDGSE